MREAIILGLATVTAAIVAGIFTVFDPVISEKFGPEPDSEVVAGDVVQLTHDGNWVNLKPNTIYKASSDGFISALSHTDDPADDFDVFTGPTSTDLIVRNRGTRYGGTVTPVFADQHWLVQRDSGNVIVQWVPMSAQTIGRSKVEVGQIEMRPNGPEWLTWQSGNMVARGFQGEVTFDQPFSCVPDIVAGLVAIDLGSDANQRLRFRVTDVTEDRFSYHFFTWANTVFHAADVRWLAHGCGRMEGELGHTQFSPQN